MNTLRVSKDRIYDVKTQVETNSRGIFAHTRIGSGACNESTVSVVMTASNRSAQVYYTLQTIARSEHKNVQVILVDDSTHDPVSAARLAEYPFIIDFIVINRSVKCWHNPVVNYNIGFKFIQGGKVIVQNAEVCHVGDVVAHVAAQLPENTYAAYDVRTTRSYEANDAIYKMESLNTNIYSMPLMGDWYQAREKNNRFHFLVAMDRAAFDKVGGFSYDYTYGSAYDDNDFVLRAQNAGLTLCSLHNDSVECGGVHLFHGWDAGWNRGVEDNKGIFLAKKALYDSRKIYIDVSHCAECFDLHYALLC